MKLGLNVVLFVVLLVGTSQIASAQNAGSNGSSATAGRSVTTSIATMFVRDPLTQSLCFRDGGPGGVFQDGQTKNRCSDLNFNSYAANSFSVGVEGGRQGVILDLGTPEELKAKYGFTETVGNGQGFASIDVRNGKALISKNYRTGELQNLAESASLFETGKSVASIPVKIGHVYLLRTTDVHDKDFEMFAKVLVVAYTPGESVTVRWQIISNDETAKR